MKLPVGVPSFAAAVLMFAGLALTSRTTSSTAYAAGSSLDVEKQKGDKLVHEGGRLAQTLGIKEMMGPLAPVALSPFFSLTILSGASLAADQNWLPIPAAVKNNALLSEQSPLHNGFVFLGLLGLTLLTAAPKLTKVTKPLGQAIDQIEAHSGIVAIVAVQFLSQMKLGDAQHAENMSIVYQAGFISATRTTIVSVFIAVASAINIFVINTVKFFFEVLIFLSPIPTVDAFFEAANKSVAALLLGLYMFSPWLAMMVNLVIFSICLVVFAWVHRRAVYMKSILGDPVLGWIAEKVFRRPPITLRSTPLTGALRQRFPDPTFVVKAFAAEKIHGVKRKAKGFLIFSGDQLYFARSRLLRTPLIVQLPMAGHRAVLHDGFISNSLELENDAGDTAAKILFSNRYDPLNAGIENALGATLTKPRDKPAEADTLLAASRSIGSAAQGDGRAALRAEFA